MIDLLLLGNGAMMPMPGRWLSSLLVRVNGELTLFDCGEGTQIPWQSSGWGFRRVGAICLSHLHADHVAGLPGILYSVAHANREEIVTIYGPQGTVQVVAGLRSIVPSLPYDLHIQEIDAEAEFELPGGLTATVISGDHSLPCLGYRLEIGRSRKFLREQAEQLEIPRQHWKALQNGKSAEVEGRSISPEMVLGPPRRGLSVGFATDTRPTSAMSSFFRNVDLLVCEGTYGDSADLPKAIANKHMTFREAATIAGTAHAERLWLTHFSPAVERPEEFLQEATSVFPATTIGFSGLETTLAFVDDDE